MRRRKHFTLRNPQEAVVEIIKARRAIVVEYTHPHECVLFWPGADPFKHFFDALNGIFEWPRITGPHLIETQVVANRLEMRVLSDAHNFIASGAARFSWLQKYLAHKEGVGVGVLQHTLPAGHKYDKVSPARDPYDGVFRGMPLIRVGVGEWYQDLHMLLTEGSKAMGYRDPFFRKLGIPMYLARSAMKVGAFDAALNIAGRIEQKDWRMATTAWIKGAYDAGKE